MSMSIKNARELEPLKALAAMRGDKGTEEETNADGTKGLSAKQIYNQLGQPLGTDQRGRPVWLVKVPPEVAQAWLHAAEHDERAHVGTMRMVTAPIAPGSSQTRTSCMLSLAKETLAMPSSSSSSSPPLPPSASSSVASSGDAGGAGAGAGDKQRSAAMPVHLATEHRLEIIPPQPGTRVFSTSKQGDEHRLEGFVKRNCVLQPVRTKDYRRVCRQRLMKAVTADKSTKSLDVLPKVTKASMMDLSAIAGGAKRQKTGAGQRVRMDEEQLKRELFRLFGERPTWTKQQLNDRLNQPDSFLAEVLKTLTEYHREGEKKGKYELKQEFRTND
jgi:hypothetical protein